MKCNQYGHELKSGACFCGQCGAPVTSDQPSVQAKYCSKCGSKLNEGNFCSHCGAKNPATPKSNTLNKKWLFLLIGRIITILVVALLWFGI